MMEQNDKPMTGKDYAMMGEEEGRKKYLEDMMKTVTEDDLYTEEENKELFSLQFDLFIAAKDHGHGSDEYTAAEKNRNTRVGEINQQMGERRAQQKEAPAEIVAAPDDSKTESEDN